jgi:hypothetical protein
MPMMERDNFEEGWSYAGDESGLYWSDFGAALQYWSLMQFRDTTVAEAAAVFNVSPDLIVSAILDNAWLDVTGDHKTPPTERTILHEGADD